MGRGSTLRLSRLIVLSPWQRIDPPSLLSYLLGRGSLLPPYCLISMAEAPSSLPIVLSPWQRIPPPFLLSYLLQLAEASSFLPIVLSPLQRFSFLLPYCIIFLVERLLPPSLLSYLLGREAHSFPPYCLMSLAERLIPSLPIVLSPWQRLLPPSLLSYLLGRGSFLPPYCLISLAERLISSLPVISSTSGTPGALVPARERVSVDRLGDQGRGFTARSDCSSVMSLVSVITKGVHHHNDSSARASACQSVAVMRATPRRGRRLSVMLRRRLLRGWILRPEILQQCSVSAPTVDTARASPCPLPSASPGSRGPLLSLTSSAPATGGLGRSSN